MSGGWATRVRGCYQRLVALTRDPQAWAYDAATVGLIERRMVRAMRSRKVA